jgi:hypothetical protein
VDAHVQFDLIGSVEHDALVVELGRTRQSYRLTVSITGILCGVWPAPVAVMVIVAW